jgi:hypothetical protein
MKVVKKKKKNPEFLCSWLATGTSQQFGILFYFRNLASSSHFFPWKNPLYRSKSYFSGQILAKLKH